MSATTRVRYSASYAKSARGGARRLGRLAYVRSEGNPRGFRRLKDEILRNHWAVEGASVNRQTPRTRSSAYGRPSRARAHAGVIGRDFGSQRALTI